MKLVELSINNHIVDVIHKHHTVLQNVGFGTHGNPLFVEAVLNSGNGGQRAQGSEREHEGQREEAAGRCQLQHLRIGSRGIA